MAKRKKKAPDRPTTPQANQQEPKAAWEIRLTEPAEIVYSELVRNARAAEERNDLTSSHCTTLRMVDEVLDRIIPHDPINRRHALAGDLSNIFRFRKGRMRIYWIASSARRQVVVLFISDTPRKEGDVYDPYQLFGRMVMSGQFNEFFAELGEKIPREFSGSYETH